MPASPTLTGLVEEITPQVLELRRALHRFPEPAHQEHRTTELLRRALERSGLSFHGRLPKTGGWVDIGPTPHIGFRADIDALPITEPAGNDPISENPGWMHACGHDAHAAIAAGIAITLSRLSPTPGVRVLFQPAEETTPGGALELVAEGVVDGLDGLLAFHVDPSLQVGKIGAKPGPITASADQIFITLHGPGGHTSRPHQTVDLVEAAGRVASELPSALRRAVDERSSIVTVFGAVHGGSAANVIPSEVVLSGTVRTLDPDLWDVLPGLVDKTLGSVLSLSGARYTLDFRPGIPPVVNDESLVDDASRAMRSELGESSVVAADQSMGGEDFANYLSEVPGALFRLGAFSGGGDLHSTGFDFNEEAITFGIHAGVAALLGLRA